MKHEKHRTERQALQNEIENLTDRINNQVSEIKTLKAKLMRARICPDSKDFRSKDWN